MVFYFERSFFKAGRNFANLLFPQRCRIGLFIPLFTTVRVSLAFPDGRTLAFPSILHRRNDGRNQCPRIRRGGDESTIVASFFLALLAPRPAP